jgi:carboxyl-terminal processing protease
MILESMKSLYFGAVVLLSMLRTEAKQADFNEVGRQMAIMLQNSHYSRLPFSVELSQRFLDDYLKALDPQRVYFRQQDVDELNEEFGGKLHTVLLNETSISAATEIHALFTKRVENRVKWAVKVLRETQIELSTHESVAQTRKDARWLKNDEEVDEAWRLQVKKAVLGEKLHRQVWEDVAVDSQGSVPPTTILSCQERIALRYERKLKEVQDFDEQRIAGVFLSAVAHAYDPHTDYMCFRETSQFKDSMKNELVGIGTQLQREEDGIVKITGLVVGGPADRGGVLKFNDRIVAVDILNSGKPEDMIDISYMEFDRVVSLIQGEEGTSVALKVESGLSDLRTTKIVVIQRAKIEQKDQQARGQIIDMTVPGLPPRHFGVITLPTFYADFDHETTRCSIDVEKILNRLVSENIEGLILDLRNNPGGSLEEVRRITGFFLGGAPVVQVKNTIGLIQVKGSDDKKPIYLGPMIVMTNSGSASASEILAGALQDFNRAVIVGDTSTFGKGTVQQPMDIASMLPYFSGRERAGSLKLTIQKFYRPSGSSTQIDGVASDIVLPCESNADLVAEKFLNHALPHDRIRPASNFTPLDAQGLFLPRLRELSLERVAASRDFSYIQDDVRKEKAQVQGNSVSLNLSVREKELNDLKSLRSIRNTERRERYARMTEEDSKVYRFADVTLDILKSGEDLKRTARGDEGRAYMRMDNDPKIDPELAPLVPSGLDPAKRESLAILKDLIGLTDSARLAGLQKPEAVID